MTYTEQQTKEVLDATIHMINTKDEIINNHAKKIAELNEKLEKSEENKEFSLYTLDAIHEAIWYLKELSFDSFSDALDFFEKDGTINNVSTTDDFDGYIDLSYPVKDDLCCIDCSFVKKESGLIECADSFSVFNTETGDKLMEITE